MDTRLKEHIDNTDVSDIMSSGMDLDEENRSGTFFQEDNKIVLSHAISEGIDILPSEEARDKFPELNEYFGKAFKEVGKEMPQDTEGGYFIRIRKGTKVELPLQACLFMKKIGFQQKVHNIILVEEDAEVHLITGCSSAGESGEAFHLGISEIYVKKGAHLNFTMIHAWKKSTTVKPMSVAIVDEDATFVSNYVCLKEVKEITMYPTAVLNGENARASFNSILVSVPNSFQDIGSRVVFNAENTQAEIVSRAVSLGGKIVARGHLKSNCKNIKAHLECKGLIVSEEGTIHAIPELETEWRDVDMSHEAAIGKVDKDEIEYLCSRGMTADEAQSVIVRGFMDIDILALPDMLREKISELEEKLLTASL